MPKYEVTLSKAIGVLVEADSEEEAKEEAVRRDTADEVSSWDDIEAIAVDCEEIAESENAQDLRDDSGSSLLNGDGKDML